jgi:hypothetical protein
MTIVAAVTKVWHVAVDFRLNRSIALTVLA